MKSKHKHRPVILDSFALSKKIEPSAIARKFFEDARELFEECLSTYDKKNPDKFIGAFKPFEQSHGIKILRFSRVPLGLYYEVQDCSDVFYVSINVYDYMYRRLLRCDYTKMPLSKIEANKC